MSKKEGSAGSEGESIVLNYLNEQNRPYSSNDIAQNLHKELGKSAVQNILDNLAQEGKIIEKAYGKQKIYLVDQSSFSDASPVEIKVLDMEIEEAEKAQKEGEKTVKEAQAELKKICELPATEDLTKVVEDLREEVRQMGEKLKHFSETSVTVDKKVRVAIRKRVEDGVKMWRTRKRYVMDFLDPLLEDYPKSPSELYEEIGLVTDESVGAKFPNNK